MNSPLFALVFLIFFDLTSVQAENLKVKVGLYENAPKVFTDNSGRPSGIFIDIIEDMAQKEGWELEYVPGTWGEGLRRLEKGEIDLMPDVAYTTERAKIYSFHQVPVLSSWYEVYALKGSGIRSVFDLNNKKILVLDQSVQQAAFARLSRGFGLDIELVAVSDYKRMFEMVANGKADAAITNRFYGMMHAGRYGLENTAIVFEPSDLFFAAPKKDSLRLLGAIDRNIEAMKENPRSVYYISLKRWTAEQVKFKFPEWIRLAALAAGFILLASLVGSFILKHQVKERTRQLNNSEQKYRELVELANSIILRWDHNGRITFLNEYGLQFFGYTAGEILGRQVADTLVPATDNGGKDLRQLINQICTNPADFEYNINQNIRRNGERVWISWANRIILDPNGQVSEILSIGTDITERRRNEEELENYRKHLEDMVKHRTTELEIAKRQAESADQLKSAFLATMSHELRTPLNSIIGFTGIMMQGLAGPLNQEQTKQMGMVQNSAHHLLSLINDVLDISKIEAGQMEVFPKPYDLGASIRKIADTIRPMAKAKGLELRMAISDGIGEIISDQRRVEQILINLLNNAVKFTNKGSVSLECCPVGKTVVISVADTGIGIKPEDREKLFKPFRQVDTGLTRNHEGTGLGLAICSKLAEKLGGVIDLESTLGMGSVFTVRLPVNKGEV